MTATRPKPFYRLVERKPACGSFTGQLTDRLVFANDHDPSDRVETSEWAFWRLWRFWPGNKAHPLYEGPR